MTARIRLCLHFHWQHPCESRHTDDSHQKGSQQSTSTKRLSRHETRDNPTLLYVVAFVVTLHACHAWTKHGPEDLHSLACNGHLSILNAAATQLHPHVHRGQRYLRQQKHPNCVTPGLQHLKQMCGLVLSAITLRTSFLLNTADTNLHL